MASIKISELNEKTNIIDNDLVAVVDSIADETKKMTYGNLKTQIVNDNFAVITIQPTSPGAFIRFDYPTGWNPQNCIILSCFRNFIENEEIVERMYNVDLETTIRMYPNRVLLTEMIENPQNYSYTFVLMKVA